MPKCCAAEPGAFTPVEIDDFVSLVLAGGEVSPNGLNGRVMTASHIAFLREKDCLLGVGGLKRPSDNHRTDVELGSKIILSTEIVPFELGWVYILPNARNRKLSFPLCRSLVSAANGRGIFATARSNNRAMHSTLEKLGFIRAGSEWPSKQNESALTLFLKITVERLP